MAITQLDQSISANPGSIIIPLEMSVDIDRLAATTLDYVDVSDSTRLDYKYRVRLFIDSVRSRGFNRGSFLDFKRQLEKRTDIAVATKNKYLAAARILLRELYRTGYLPVDITVGVKSFTQYRGHKRTGITVDEMTTIVNHTSSLPTTPDNARLRVLLSLLSLQGLRQIEIVRLDVTDLDLANQVAYVRGKGRDDKQPICLHPETARTVMAYLKTNQVADGPMFRGHSNNSRRLTTRGLRMIIKQLLDSLGIDKTVHGFRHYFTTMLIREYGGDLLQVSQYTRHRGLDMLQVYNDAVMLQDDLPRYYRTFQGVKFD